MVFESAYSNSLMQTSFQPTDKTCYHAPFLSRPHSWLLSPHQGEAQEACQVVGEKYNSCQGGEGLQTP